MFIPIDQITETLRTLYFDVKLRVLNSTLVYVQGTMNSWAPHMLIGTRRNLILANFNKKDDKQVKIFNRKEARITESEDERIIKAYDHVVLLEINQDEFVVRFLSLHDQRNWTFLIQSGMSPIFEVSEDYGDVHLNEGFWFSVGSVDGKYFSEIRPQDLPLSSLKQKRSAYLELGDFCKFMTEAKCSTGLLLNEGNLVYRVLGPHGEVLPLENRFFNVYNSMYVDIKNVYVDKKEEELRIDAIMRRKFVYETKNWNELYEQKLREVHEMYALYSKHQLPSEMTDSMNETQKEEVPEDMWYDLYDPIKLSEQLIDKLKHNGMCRNRDEELRAISFEENRSLIGAITEILMLFCEFHEYCEKVARTMVDEFILPTHEQEYLDVNTWRNPLTMDYLTKTYSKEYDTFRKNCEKRSEEELDMLEDKMTQFGPVHGSIMSTLGPALREYEQLLMQPRNFMAGTRLSSLPPGPHDDPVFEYGPQNGFPDGLIETTIDGFIYEKVPMIYPNELPPIYEVSNGGINFKLVVDKDGHSELNVRRDTYSQANRDNVVIDQAKSELGFMQTLYDSFTIDNIEEQLRIPLCCSIKYCGFIVYCQADIDDRRIVYGYGHSGNEFIVDENASDRIERTAEQLNIEDHLFVANAEVTEKLFSQPADVEFILRLADNLAQYDGYNAFSNFLRGSALDICAQMHELKSMELKDGACLLEAKLSALVEVFEDGNYYIRNLESMAFPDLPTAFVANILPLLNMEATKKNASVLVQDKLSAIAEACKLPGKFTHLIDEKYNPDVCLVGLKISESEIGRITEEIKTEFSRISGEGRTPELDKEAFGRFIAYELCDHQYSAGLQQCERWSDLYRIEYIPLLMSAIDHEILEDNLSLLEVPTILKYFQVPSYLWLYAANISELPEVLEITRLAVAACAISRYLDDSLRRIRRQIQQYGIENAFVLELDPILEKKKDKKAMLEQEELLNLETMLIEAANKMEAEQVVSRLRPKRMNFFTAKDKAERLTYADEFIKEFVALFLNNIFALNENNVAIWQVVNQIVEHFYLEHSFAEEYTDLLRETQLKDELQISSFVHSNFSPETLFCDGHGPENGGLGVNYRLLLLDWICDQSGVIINDLNTYVFTQTDQIFRYSDIIGFATNFEMPMPEFLGEQCNIPYRSWLHTALEIEAEVANKFSFRLNYQINDEKFSKIESEFVIKPLRPVENNEIIRQFHYNVSFEKLTNLTNTHEFERLLADTAIYLASSVSLSFASLLKAEEIEKTMPHIRRYIETEETAVLFVSAALAICRRNSLTGAVIYRAYMQVLEAFSHFEFRLKEYEPSILLTIEREIIQNESIYGDMRVFSKFESEHEAAEMALISIENILRNGSIEIAKVLMLYAAHLYAIGDFARALKTLQQAEQTTETRNKDKCDLLLEIYSLKGIIHGKLNEIAKAEACYSAAKNIHSYHIDCSKRKLARLSLYEEELEGQIMNFEESGVLLPTNLAFIFLESADNSVLADFKQAFLPNDDLNESYEDAFSNYRGIERMCNQAILAKLSLERLYNQKSIFPVDVQRAYDLLIRSDKDIAIACITRAISTLNYRLLNSLAEHDRSYLFLSEILENEALTYLGAQPPSKMAIGRKSAIEALRMRQEVLSQTHIFTLRALYVISEFDARTGEAMKQITALEFILRSIGNETIENLNPATTETVDRLNLFKKLANCVFATLPKEMQPIIEESREVAARRRDLGTQLILGTMEKICDSDNIAKSIAGVVESAARKLTKDTVSDLVYLLKCIQDDAPVSTDLQFDAQGGQNRTIYDLVEAVQVNGQNQQMMKEAYEPMDEEDDW